MGVLWLGHESNCRDGEQEEEYIELSRLDASEWDSWG